MTEVSQKIRVMKFGGSSMGSAGTIQQVMKIIENESKKSPLTVVVSAMGHTTDWLIESIDAAATGNMPDADAVVDRIEELAISNGTQVLKSIHEANGEKSGLDLIDHIRNVLAPLRQLLKGVSIVREKTPQTLDLVMSFGERISASILSLLLDAAGTKACYVDARNWVTTDATFGMARVEVNESFEKLYRLQQEWNNCIPIHTGFLGRTDDGRTTTLGRNGSDYTATLLAQGLSAADVTIWTDVSGIMTADPNIVPDAYTVPRLSHRESLELANLGWSMFHPRTMVPLIQSNVPLRIRNTLRPDDLGTLVDAEGSRNVDRPTCVTSLENLTLFEVEYKQTTDQNPIAERVLRALDTAGITVWIATQTPRGRAVTVLVPREMSKRAEHTINMELAVERERGLVEPLAIREPVTLVTLVAEAMGQTVNVAGRFFHAIGTVGIPIRASVQGVSERSISCVIDDKDTRVALRTTHAAFNLAHQQVSVFLLGKGTVGGHLIEQIRSQRDKLRKEHNVLPNLVALADSKRAIFNLQGIDLDHYQELLDATPVSGNGPDIIPVLEKLRRQPVPVLVDCTAEEGMEKWYIEAFSRGVHVVAANKKALTLDMEPFRELMATAKRYFRSYHYETTVGASLPVINTLKNLIKTGDEVLLIEGAFSGTLGYLCNELMSGVPLSTAVRTAKELGYTEPHPRDDLNGMDVARKALILARELGLELNIADVAVEPFVPREMLAKDDLAEFFASLESHDAKMASTIEKMKKEGKTLRYLATIDPFAADRAEILKVRPMAVDSDHPAAGLRGAESFVAFTTERYRQYPLIVRGSGAGGAVTAAGVLADVLTLSQNLRGL